MNLSKEDARAIRKGCHFWYRVDRAGAELHVCESILRNDSEYIVRDSEKKYDGLVFFSGYDTHSGWTAVKALVRAGDELLFRWSDNSSSYLKAAEIREQGWRAIGQEDDARHHPDYLGLHDDCLYLTILRNGKTVVHDLHVDHSICPENSARAIRKGAY